MLGSLGRLLACATAVMAVMVAPPGVWGAEVTEIVDAYPPDPDASGVTVALSLDWGWRARQGDIRREAPCLAADAVGGVQLCPEGNRVVLLDELEVERVTSSLELAATVAFGKRLALTLTLPIVLRDETTLDYAGGVTPGNTTVDPSDAPSLFAVSNAGRSRGGLGDLRLMIRAAPVSAALDPGGFSWALGASLVTPSAGVRRATNDDVGGGLWIVGVDTAVSARVWDVLEPFFRVDAAFALATSSSPFADLGATHVTSQPQHQAGLTFGADLIPFERPALHSAVRLTLGARLGWVFEGRGRSDLFDALGSSACDPADLDAPCDLTTYDRGADGASPRVADGITNLQGHAVLSGWLGLRYEVFETLALSARASVTHETDHYLTYAEPGVDLDGRGDVQASNSDGVNELNPTFNSAYDRPGTRFRTGDTLIFAIDLGVRGTF